MMDLSRFAEKRLCVATSGGVDSVALLHYCKTGEASCGYRLFAVHCEHGIRGEESVADMRFVELICKAWNVPLFVFKEDCPARAKKEKCSLETAARNFRYESFCRLIEDGKVDFIATAHHESDEAETVLFRLARGTSLAGLRCIEAENGWLIRPFLDWSKAEITAYARENKLEYREDKTNFETDATRNKIRLCVLPELEKAVAGAGANIARFAALAGEDEAFLREESEKLLSGDGERYTVVFSKKKPLFCRACLSAMRALGVEKDYTAAHLQAAFDLQTSERGSTLDLPRGVVAEKGLRGIEFFLRKAEVYEERTSETPYSENGFDGGRYAVNVTFVPTEAEKDGLRALKFDADKVPVDAVFRFRKEGDKIEKFGGGSKSLKKFFNEKKTPVNEREYLPLIASEKNGEVYAVCGVEIAECIKVTAETKRIAYLITRKKS
ncbi:MAG: tRNA lysidine(34) synthetase TilS [Clostridia bacterium]|nr:tRNA lysidine(34) synthetase TilS [Clostridia bacterium]